MFLLVNQDLSTKFPFGLRMTVVTSITMQHSSPDLSSLSYMSLLPMIAKWTMPMTVISALCQGQAPHAREYRLSDTHDTIHKDVFSSHRNLLSQPKMAPLLDLLIGIHRSNYPNGLSRLRTPEHHSDMTPTKAMEKHVDHGTCKVGGTQFSKL